MRQIRALLAGLALLALIGGVPVLLVTFVGTPLPTAAPHWSSLAMTHVDSTFVIKVFAVAVWLAWAHFVICVAAETGSVLSQLRGRPRAHRRIPFDVGSQQVARHLVFTVLSGMVGAAALGPTAAMAAAPAAPVASSAATGVSTTVEQVSASTSSTTSSSTSLVSPVSSSTAFIEDAATAPMTSSTPSPQHEMPAAAVDIRTSSSTTGTPSSATSSTAPETESLPQYVVAGPASHHDNLWDIAEAHLGDPMRWHEIWTLNQQQTMNDGQVFEHPELIHPGWVLTMPADATGLTALTATASSPPSSPAGEQELGWPSSGSHAGQEQSTPSRGQDTHLDTDAPSPTASPTTSAPTDAPSTDAEASPPSPGAATDATSATPSGEAAPSSAAATDPSPSPSSSSPSTSSSSSSSLTASSSADTSLDAGTVNVRTVGGIGALLGAGLMGALALRRRRSDVRRRAGFRTQELDATLAEVEEDLLTLHTPMSFEVIDRCLRRLSTDLAERDQELPGIVTARLNDDGLLLTLFEATTLPAPWAQADDDGFEWLLSCDVVEPNASGKLGDAALAPAPWPSLVTIGHDEQDAQILIDLEELLALNITAGSQQESEALLRALAVELATTPWGSGLQVTLVGCCAELADLLPERMQYLPDLASLEQELQVRRQDVLRVLQDSGLDDIAHARQTAEAPDVWSPHIIVLGQPLHADERARISELLNDTPRVGIATVTTNEQSLGEWSLTVDATDPAWAELAPVATRLRPQGLGEQDYAAIVQLLAHADSDPVQRTNLAFSTPTVEPRLVGLIPGLDQDVPHVIDLTSADTTKGTSPIATDLDHSLDLHVDVDFDADSDVEPRHERDADDVLGTGSDADTPQTPLDTSDEEEDTADGSDRPAAPDSDDETAASQRNDPGRPTPADTSQAGPADTADPAAGAADGNLSAEEGDASVCTTTSQARLQELLSRVGFDARLPMLRVLGPVDAQRQGETLPMTGRQIALGIFLAFNPGATSQDVINDFVRKPTAPSTLHPRIAELRKVLGKHPNTGAPLMPLNTTATGYQLDEGVLTDWELLQRLADSDDTDRLEAALGLVRGAPFARIGSRAMHYYVWMEHAHLEREIRQFVTDIAVTVASRSLQAGQYRRTAAAAAKGLLLEPGHEQLRRLEWIALEALGEREELRHSVAELARVNEELGCEEDPDTLDLIDELRARGALQAA